MVDLLADYIPISALIEETVDFGLEHICTEHLKEQIQESARERVYSQGASHLSGDWHIPFDRRMDSDGGLIDKDSMETWVNNHTLTLYNSSVVQNIFGGSYAGTPLTPIVEDGNAAFHQSGRPFMDEALNEYVSSGVADNDIATALHMVGFDVHLG